MKTRLQLMLLFILISVSAFAQIPNPSFEFWTNNFPDDWYTNNMPPALPVTQSTDAYAGTYAAKCEIVNNMGSTLTPSIYNIGSNGIGFPITQAHGSLTGWFKGALTGSDIGYIQVAIYDNSPIPVTMGVGWANLVSSVSYQQFDAPLVYLNPGIAAFASIFVSVLDTSGATQGTIGSYIIVDDFSFTAPVKVNSLPDRISFNVMPNPVSDKLSLEGKFSDDKFCEVKLFNSIGMIVKSENIKSVSTQLPPIDLSTLPEGNYILALSDGEISVARKVVVKR